jgi:peptidoglycan pentaglycine glycine transferase (the first glycine)
MTSDETAPWAGQLARAKLSYKLHATPCDGAFTIGEYMPAFSHDWDRFVTTHPHGHTLQLSAWGSLKARFGWAADRVVLAQDGDLTAGAQILYRPLPLGLGTMAYIPYGALVAEDGAWEPLWDAIHANARQHRAAFLKWEPGLGRGITVEQRFLWQFRYSPQTIQPPRTIVIDLQADEDAILARMNQGTRRKIRKSLAGGIRYYEAGAEDVARFTAIMQQTGARNTFGTHTPAYYEAAFALLVPTHAALILAEQEGETLAGVFVAHTGRYAQYLYGASSDTQRNLMASYGVQWQAIRWAKARGAAYYDMWGVPDHPQAALEAQFQERGDGLWGVYGFKRGWGGDILRSDGAWDYRYRHGLYGLYRIASRARP